jgi:subtilisin family serine protease
VVNISAGIAQLSIKNQNKLTASLDYAAKKDVLVVVAAGNHSQIGTSPITGHHWVIPVAACDVKGVPSFHSNLGRSLSRRGLAVPAESITSLNSQGGSMTFGGTSAAAPFVTGAIALLLSELPEIPGDRIKSALIPSLAQPGRSINPSMLNAWKAYETLRRYDAKWISGT